MRPATKRFLREEATKRLGSNFSVEITSTSMFEGIVGVMFIVIGNITCPTMTSRFEFRGGSADSLKFDQAKIFGEHTPEERTLLALSVKREVLRYLSNARAKLLIKLESRVQVHLAKTQEKIDEKC